MPPCNRDHGRGARADARRLSLLSPRLGRTGVTDTQEEAARTKASSPPASPPRRSGGLASSSAGAAPARRGESFLSPQQKTFGWAPLVAAMEQRGRSERNGKRWATGALPPSPFIAREGQPAPPTITGNDGFPFHVAGTCQVGQLPRQHGEAETPTSNQSPRANRGRRLLGPAALCTCRHSRNGGP